jgi:hypothetical protein
MWTAVFARASHGVSDLYIGLRLLAQSMLFFLTCQAASLHRVQSGPLNILADTGSVRNCHSSQLTAIVPSPPPFLCFRRCGRRLGLADCGGTPRAHGRKHNATLRALEPGSTQGGRGINLEPD